MIHGNFFSANDWAAHHLHPQPPTTLSAPCFQRLYYTGFIFLSKAGHAWEGATWCKICVYAFLCVYSCMFTYMWIYIPVPTVYVCMFSMYREWWHRCVTAKWFNWFTCCIFMATSKVSELTGLITWNKQVLAAVRSYTATQYIWLFFLLKLGLVWIWKWEVSSVLENSFYRSTQKQHFISWNSPKAELEINDKSGLLQLGLF